ncbi:MAG: hypothetical protein U0228_07080 [Myxococcaceae bacterium]
MAPALAQRVVVATQAWWRQVRPRPDATSGARRLVGELQQGSSLGEALTEAADQLARVAVSEAAKSFEGGVLALFIVDVRDSLRRQLSQAGGLSQDAVMRGALELASRRVDEDTFVQHLINALLEATGIYVESMLVERLDEAKCERAVSALFQRSLCTLVGRSDAARRLGQRPSRLEFIVPSPSAPR